MKKFFSFFFVIAITVVLTLVFSAAVLQPKAAAAPAPVAAPLPAPSVAAVPDPHPHIHDAIESMRAAKHHLESAEHDFDGHRAKSIEHLDAAIHEAEICMSMK
jgi:hypothetical protein